VPKYRILFHRKADKVLDKLDKKTRQRLLEKILCLENFPEFNEHLDIVKMAGQKDFYRLRTDRLRTMFTIDKATRTIIILKIVQREAAYE
jgi:mRNA-degrading endonuclease RelE of RelBE toxin-antitoxin system